MKALLPWATSVVTLWGMWALSRKHWWGWLVGLGNQALWVTFALVYEAYGLLPLTAALIVVYTRGLIKWRRDGLALHLCPHPYASVESDVCFDCGLRLDTTGA